MSISLLSRRRDSTVKNHDEPNPWIDTVLPLAGVGVLIAIVIALSAPSIQQQMTKVQAIRSKVDKIKDEKAAAGLESDKAAQEETIASQRVESNCVWVKRVINGMTLLDPQTRHPIVSQNVCDFSGNTAITDDNGVAIPESFARTRKAVPKQYHKSQWFQQQTENTAL